MRYARTLLLVFVMVALSSMAHAALTMTSPNGQARAVFRLEGGRPCYDLTVGGQRVLLPSYLGFELADGGLDRDFRMLSSSCRTHDDTWVQVWGEEDSVRNHYNEWTIRLKQRRGQRRRLTLVFRLFDDGLGFRYIIPRQPSLHRIEVSDEKTEFALARDAEAWSIATNHTSYYEGIYRKSPVSQKDTVCTPLTIEYAPQLYLAIHEAALIDYAAINLTPRGHRLATALTPWSDGLKVKAVDTLTSPWRTVIWGRTPGELITNRVMLNLNEPSRIDDTSWIEPGKYVGMWWGIHKKKYTWEQGPHHGATTENVKRYIDFAARHGFQGVLSEGWNPGWGQGERLTYLKSYPDFDIAEVNRYALSKGVRWIGHMESWGQSRLIESEMDSAFAWYAGMGMNTVKTGYVGHLFDGKELARSQYGIRHYLRVIEAAARHRIMIDNHEPAMPTGLQRTYPNLMTQEAVRGQEYNAWDRGGGNPPEHTCTLPFTRGLAGPTDFTPAIFDFSEVVPGTRPHATLAKQLAEFVVIYSPLQMAADEIEHYEGHPALSFIESCPTNWSRTLVLHGTIGEQITIARKEREGERWFVGSITDATARDMEVELSFLTPGRRYRLTVYEDGHEADYERNPMSMHIRRQEVTSADRVHLRLARSGGAALRIEPLDK